MQRNEEPRRVAGSGDPLSLTPSEVYKPVKQIDLPAGTYSLMDGIAKMYGINTKGNRECRILFAMAAAFVAGCTYVSGKGGR